MGLFILAILSPNQIQIVRLIYGLFLMFPWVLANFISIINFITVGTGKMVFLMVGAKCTSKLLKELKLSQVNGSMEFLKDLVLLNFGIVRNLWDSL